jgi:hypothetical protein
MKKIIRICSAILMSASVFLPQQASAQAPNKMSYQAVIRNTSNSLVTSSAVGMRISILQTSPSGSAVYIETQAPTTNANGLVSIEIGGGTVVSGNFANIDWANGPYFVKTETDPLGGSNYSITGTSQLLSVPYALHAKSADIITGNISETDPIFSSSVASGITGTDTTNWNNDLIYDGDTTYWKVNGNNVFYNQGNVGIGLNSSNSNSLLYLRSDSYNQNTLWAQGYVTDNLGDPAIVNIRGIADGPAVLEISKASGPARNFGWIRMGVDGNLTNLYGSNGGFGIGIQPQRALHINDVMRLEPRNTAPSSPSKGDIYFDNTLNKLRVYDGTTWQNCW